jgi:hypothetical protein
MIFFEKLRDIFTATEKSVRAIWAARVGHEIFFNFFFENETVWHGICGVFGNEPVV